MNSPRESPRVALGSLLKAVGVERVQSAGLWRCWGWKCLELGGSGIVLLLARGPSMMLHEDVQQPFSRPY